MPFTVRLRRRTIQTRFLCSLNGRNFRNVTVRKSGLFKRIQPLGFLSHPIYKSSKTTIISTEQRDREREKEMDCSNRSSMMLAIALVLAILMVGEEAGAQTVPDCAANLVPCAAFLNSTRPPESCCTPLRNTVNTQRDCLCNLYNNPGLIQSFGINITQALELPKYCGVSSDLSLCNRVSAPPPAVPLTPPAVPGRDEDNAVGKVAWAGASGLLLFWVSIMAY